MVVWLRACVCACVCVCCRVCLLQCVAVCYSVVQYVALFCIVLQLQIGKLALLQPVADREVSAVADRVSAPTAEFS